MKIGRFGVRRVLALVAVVMGLGGCAAVTRIEPATPGTTLALRGITGHQLPRDEKLGSKATGQYEFMASAPSGQTMYGLLPLRVNGGTMAVSILFFAPALAIGGFRDVFPYYQIDPEAGLVRYKIRETDDWRLYKPTAAEASRARSFFEKCGAEARQADCTVALQKQ